ncbi:uncharacterized protein LOC144361802, partial [Saccoglossus kowalevskii]
MKGTAWLLIYCVVDVGLGVYGQSLTTKTPTVLVTQGRTALAGLANRTGLSEGFWVSVIATSILCFVAVCVSCCICCWPVDKEVKIQKIFKKNVHRITRRNKNSNANDTRNARQSAKRAVALTPQPHEESMQYNYYNPVIANAYPGDGHESNSQFVQSEQSGLENPGFTFVALPPSPELQRRVNPQASEFPVEPDELRDDEIDYTIFRKPFYLREHGVPDTMEPPEADYEDESEPEPERDPEPPLIEYQPPFPPPFKETPVPQVPVQPVAVVEEIVETLETRTIGINTDPTERIVERIIVTRRPDTPPLTPMQMVVTSRPDSPPAGPLQTIIHEEPEETEWVLCRDVSTSTEKNPLENTVKIAYAL